MSNWERKRLGDISNSCLGKMLDKSKNKGEFQPYLANLNVQWGEFKLGSLQKMRFKEGEEDRYGVKLGDLIVCEGGEPGRCAIWRDELPNIKIQKALHRVRVHSEYCSDFLFYRMLQAGRNKEFDRHFIGSTIKHLTGIGLKDVEFEFPDLEKQKSISSVLRVLDKKIELNNKINAELEAMTKLIYDYWFVQFDFPDANGKPYKSSGGKMVYNETLKREIPEGWADGTLADIAELVRGVTYSKDDIAEKGATGTVPILRATNISGHEIDLDDMVYVPESFVSKKQMLNRYDVLITMSSGSKEHIGKNGFFYFEDSVSFGAFCAKLVAKDGLQYYLYSYTQSELMFSTIKNECLGTNINNLNSSLVYGFKIVSPEKDLVQKFNDHVDTIFKKIGSNQKENWKLIELRDWLLPMLMNGQVTVNS